MDHAATQKEIEQLIEDQRAAEQAIKDAGIEPGAIVFVETATGTKLRAYRLRITAVRVPTAGVVVLDGWRLRKDDRDYAKPTRGLVRLLDRVHVARRAPKQPDPQCLELKVEPTGHQLNRVSLFLGGRLAGRRQDVPAERVELVKRQLLEANAREIAAACPQPGQTTAAALGEPGPHEHTLAACQAEDGPARVDGTYIQRGECEVCGVEIQRVHPAGRHFTDTAEAAWSTEPPAPADPTVVSLRAGQLDSARHDGWMIDTPFGWSVIKDVRHDHARLSIGVPGPRVHTYVTTIEGPEYRTMPSGRWVRVRPPVSHVETETETETETTAGTGRPIMFRVDRPAGLGHWETVRLETTAPLAATETALRHFAETIWTNLCRDRDPAQRVVCWSPGRATHAVWDRDTPPSWTPRTHAL